MAKKAHFGRISDVDVRLLRVFRAVVSSGGLAAAEFELNIGRSTISRHVSDLETRLGRKLCNRGPGGFSLTDEGARVDVACNDLFAAFDAFHTSINDPHGAPSGHLIVGLFDKVVTNSSAHWPEAIALFDQRAPSATIEIHRLPANEIVKGVLSGQFDIAVAVDVGPMTNVQHFPLYTEQMYLYCGKKHPINDFDLNSISVEEVRGFKFAGLAFPSPNMSKSNELKFSRNADAFDEEAVAMLILSGKYIGFLPEHYASSFVETSEMRAINPKTIRYSSEHFAVVRKNPPPNTLVEVLLRCLIQTHKSK